MPPELGSSPAVSQEAGDKASAPEPYLAPDASKGSLATKGADADWRRIGARVAGERRAAGLSQSGLATALGVTKSYVQKIEYGTRTNRPRIVGPHGGKYNAIQAVLNRMNRERREGTDDPSRS